jgi:hypothetical protein
VVYQNSAERIHQGIKEELATPLATPYIKDKQYQEVKRSGTRGCHSLRSCVFPVLRPAYWTPYKKDEHVSRVLTRAQAKKTSRTDVHGVFLSGTRGSKLGPNPSENVGFSRFSEGSSTHRPQEQSAPISVYVGLSQKRCSKCSKLEEKLREIEELLSSGRYDRAHELVVEIVD